MLSITSCFGSGLSFLIILDFTRIHSIRPPNRMNTKNVRPAKANGTYNHSNGYLLDAVKFLN